MTSPSFDSRESTTLSPRWPQYGHFTADRTGTSRRIPLLGRRVGHLPHARNVQPGVGREKQAEHQRGTDREGVQDDRGADGRIVPRAVEGGRREPKRLVEPANRSRRRDGDADDEQGEDQERPGER